LGAQADKHAPGWYELPFWRMVKYVAYGVLAGFLSSYVLVRAFNFDWLIINFHLKNLWLLAPETIIIVGSLHIWNWSRKSEKKKRQKQAQEQLNKLLQTAGGETKK
jgi:H+/Cl- antiporter ClcA